MQEPDERPGVEELKRAAAERAVDDYVKSGMVLGLGFAAGPKQGLLLVIALAVEFLLLAVSIASAFKKGASRLLVLGATLGVAAMVPIGSMLAGPISGASTQIRTAAYAFGLIAPTSKSSMISCSLARTFWTFSICKSYIGLLLITRKATALSTTAMNTARPNIQPPSLPQRERCRTE